MYQTNVAGAEDTAFLDINTLLTLMFLRFDFRNQILTRYPRAKLADDGVQVGPGRRRVSIPRWDVGQRQGRSGALGAA